MQRTLKITTLLIAATVMAGCAGQRFILPTTSGTVQVSGQSAVRAGESSDFTATLPQGIAGGVQWSVNGVIGGDQTIGTISSSGVFQAPAAVPSPSQVQIEATSVSNSSVSGTIEVNLLNPVPLVTAVVATDKDGFFQIEISGANFVRGAVAKINGAPASSTVLSPTKMQAVVPSTMTAASSVEVSVANPEPGVATSEGIICLLNRAVRPLRGALTEPSLPATPFDYVAYAVTNLPAHFSDSTSTNGDVAGTNNTPQTNPITNAGATLGRVLFYDRRLSVNNTISCGSCHRQINGFADPDQFSTGVNGKTPRHGMALTNAKYYRPGKFFWDERAATLEEQALMPIQNSIEMGMTLPALSAKLQATSFYPALFQAAFGTPEVTSDRIAKAIAQFIRAMVSYQSKLDQVIKQTPGVVLTGSELAGRLLFNGPGRCNACHSTSAQIAAIPENNGLDAATLTDQGAGDGKFKVPSLRNVAVRVRFMHDGRFATLEDVIEFYNSGIQAHPNLSPVQKDSQGNPLRHNWTPQQKADLLAFMQALTDNAFLSDPKFANPF